LNSFKRGFISVELNSRREKKDRFYDLSSFLLIFAAESIGGEKCDFL